MVRIATHPEMTKMGYGGRAIELLSKFYSGQLPSLSEAAPAPSKGARSEEGDAAEGGGGGLTEEKILARKSLPPLLVPVTQRRADALDYIGVSFGITSELHRFWRRNAFKCIYVRQTASDLTGEHTAICIRQLQSGGSRWLDAFEADFKRRFVSLLAYEFRAFTPPLPLAILEPKHVRSGGAEGRGGEGQETAAEGALTVAEVEMLLTSYDLKRLEAYASNIVDHHIIMDLVPTLARLYYLDRLPIALSFTQGAMLLGIGLQNKTVDDLEKDLKLEARQLLANFNKVVVRITKFLRSLREEHAEKSLARKQTISGQTVTMSLDDELSKDAKAAHKKLLAAAENAARGGGGGGDDEYAVADDDAAWQAVLGKTKDGSIPLSVSIPKKRQVLPRVQLPPTLLLSSTLSP